MEHVPRPCAAFTYLIRRTRTRAKFATMRKATLRRSLTWVGRGRARLFPSPRNEGSDAPRRRVVRITPDGPDDHSGRTRIAGSWRISGCAAPTRRATRHLPLSRSRPVGPLPGVLVLPGGYPMPPEEAAYVEPPSQVPHPAPPSRRLMRAPLSGRDVSNLG